MRIPWPLYLAWKQLFPSQRKISFFSMLAIIGVALGVNVMIVVIAFMQGFQNKFRNDIINTQGHARAVPLARYAGWKEIPKLMLDTEGVKAVTPYLHAQLLLQSGNYHSIPFVIGLRPEDADEVLPIGAFLERGMTRLWADYGEDVTPLPTIDALEALAIAPNPDFRTARFPVTDADAAAFRSVLRDHLAATIELLDEEDRFYRKHIPQRLLAYLRAPSFEPLSGPSDIAALPRYRPPPRQTWRRY